jgi:hypothetical protein
MSLVQRAFGGWGRNSAARSLAVSGAMLVACVGGAAYWSATAAGAAPAAKGDKPAAKSDDEKKSAADADKPVDFMTDIQPVLNESCVRCHKAPGAGGPGGRGPGAGGGEGAQRGPGGPGGGGAGGRGGGRGPGGGLRLDDKAAALKGGKHGKAIVAGKADDSLLYKVLKAPVKVGNEEVHLMPKGRPGQDAKPLSDEQIDSIKRWIDQGAKWPDEPAKK